MRARPALHLLVGALATVIACGSRTSLDADTVAGDPRACGNGALDPGEACDDGNKIDTDACRADCTKARCGDGVVWVGTETCDDGNTDDGDGCPAGCGPTTCGDGVVQPPEQCDDGNRDNTDACLSSCVAARCGDGIVWTGHEGCDDANRIDDDECDNRCEPAVCGDGKRAGHEECDDGAGNQDRPAFEVSQPSTPAFGTNALVRRQSAAAFYNYFSASSHTGFEARGESRLYMYVDGTSGRLSMFVTHGQDDNQPSSRVDMDITGIPPGFAIDLSDDNSSEFFASGPTSAAGRWTFNQNSDGGVLGGLPFPGNWTIVVTPNFILGVTAWGFVRADLTRAALRLEEPVTIRAFDARSTCRKNCTRPRCGDGVLDGGEVCDDGNTRGGDGCAADCARLD